jgi:hypothetical protein
LQSKRRGLRSANSTLFLYEDCIISHENTIAELRCKSAALTADIESGATERTALLNKIGYLTKERDEMAQVQQTVNLQRHELQQALQTKQVELLKNMATRCR